MKYLLLAARCVLCLSVACVVIHVSYVAYVQIKGVKLKADYQVMLKGTIRCVHEEGYEGPIPQTINAEIMEAVAKALDVKIVWKSGVDWADFINGIDEHWYDAVCMFAWSDKIKMKKVVFSDAAFYDPLYAYVRADDTRFDGDISLLNKPNVKIIAQNNRVSLDMARQHFPKANVTALSSHVFEGVYFTAVAEGQADVWVTSPHIYQKYRHVFPGPEKLKPVVGINPIAQAPMAMALAPDSPKLHKRVNSALQTLVDNGDMAKIVRKYSKDYILRQPTDNAQ